MPPLRRTELLAIIKSRQKADGSFDSLSFREGSEPTVSLNTFTTSLILSCLASVRPAAGSEDERSVAQVTAAGADFLLREKSAHWSWNYWQRGNAEANRTPCPDDLDDTSMALYALSAHRPQAITGDALAQVTRLLTLAEDRVGGPYHTWIIDRKKDGRWHDVDIVVNANIATFLKTQNVRLPRLVSFADACIKEGKFNSKYYTPLAAAYAISRWYDGSMKKELAVIVANLKQKDGTWGDTLSDTLAISTLARLGADETVYAKALRRLEGATCEAIPFYVEAIKDKVVVRSGAEALTAAFCLKALELGHAAGGSNAREASVQPAALDIQDAVALRTHDEVLRRARETLSLFPRKTVTKIDSILERMTSRDPGRQITLLPYFFARGMADGGKVPDSLAIELGTANLLGWLAYKIYDDILDDEGEPGLLPVANVCLRAVTDSYRRILPAEHQPLFDELMNATERANAWERESCRIGILSAAGTVIEAATVPTYSNHAILADKSLAHALGPAAILTTVAGKGLFTDLRQTLGFFRNYIIARQLNDDAHDWYTDLERGFANSVSAKVLKTYFGQIAPLTSCNVGGKKRELEGIFWDRIVDAVLVDISDHISQARKNLGRIGALSDTAYLESLLAPLERAVSKTAAEKRKTLDFLASYKAA